MLKQIKVLCINKIVKDEGFVNLSIIFVMSMKSLEYLESLLCFFYSGMA